MMKRESERRYQMAKDLRGKPVADALSAALALALYRGAFGRGEHS